MVEKNRTLALLHMPLVVVAFTVVGGLLAVLSFGQLTAQDASLPRCPSAIQIVNPANFQVVNGQAALQLHAAADIQSIEQVLFYLDDDQLGRASRDLLNPDVWRLAWDTRSAENGKYDLQASVKFHGSGEDCMSQAQPISVDNPGLNEPSNLRVRIVSGLWSGPTNVNFGFTAIATLENSSGQVQDVTPQTSFGWSTTAGSILGQNEFGDFFSGATIDNGTVKVVAQYGMQVAEAETYVDISLPVSNPTYPAPQTDEDVARGRSDPEVDDCFRERLGNEGYQILIGGQRLSEMHFEQVRTCFARRQFVIPVNVIPIAPQEVYGLSRSPRLSIASMSNTLDQVGQTGLEFSGTADPDSTVLLYIYSEPLVVATRADSEGIFRYRLEDLLEPGTHEVYAVAATNGEYLRSEPTKFVISDGEIGDNNPKGRSLAITTGSGSEDQESLVTIAVVAAMMLMASLFLTRFVWFKKDGGIDDSNENALRLEQDKKPRRRKKT